MGGDWRDKAGGLMCVGHSAASFGDMTRALVDAGVCGIILNSSAFSDAETTAGLIYSIKHYAARPLFIGVRHETLDRVADSTGFSSLPSMRQLWMSGDAELARHIGQVWGRELRKVGVDMTLGPSVDVTRSLSARSSGVSLQSTARRVARIGAAFIEGQQSEGVATSAAHFPGSGDIKYGRQQDLPHLPHGIARLDEVELLPFRAAVEARVAGMTVGHVLFDALDGNAPASLSRAIVFGLLRQKLGYRGLVMIDDVDNRALTRRFSRDAIARSGVGSGADCFLCASRPETAFELIDAIVRGVSEGEIFPERIESARRRIAPLLHRYVRGPGQPSDSGCFVGAPARAARALIGPGVSLDPGIDAPAHVGPGALATDKKQYQH